MTARVRRPCGASRTRRRRAALLVLVTAAAVSCGRSDDASSAAPSTAPPGSATSSTPTPSAASPPPAEPPAEQPTEQPTLGPEDAVRTVVVSDRAHSATGDPTWPDLLEADLETAGVPMDVAREAQDGAGFTSSPSFADLVARTAEGSTQLVVLFDSRLAGTGTLTEAAEDTFTAVERAAPDALLVVVGPLGAEGTADLAAATARAGGTYVDPRAEGWPAEPTHPELAELLRPHLQPIVEVLAASGANR